MGGLCGGAHEVSGIRLHFFSVGGWFEGSLGGWVGGLRVLGVGGWLSGWWWGGGLGGVWC